MGNFKECGSVLANLGRGLSWPSRPEHAGQGLVGADSLSRFLMCVGWLYYDLTKYIFYWIAGSLQNDKMYMCKVLVMKKVGM